MKKNRKLSSGFELVPVVEVMPDGTEYCEHSCPYLQDVSGEINQIATVCKRDNFYIDFYDWYLAHCGDDVADDYEGEEYIPGQNGEIE